MQEKTIIYGITNLGLLFVPESRAKELAESNKALLTARTWGEFKSLGLREMRVDRLSRPLSKPLFVFLSLCQISIQIK